MCIDFIALKKALVITRLTQVQVDSINAILEECKLQGVVIKNQVAYILATAWHESYFKPIIESGGVAYLKSKPYYPLYGRGFIQLTWEDNYKKEGDRLGIDLVSNPDKALEIPIAANIIVHGMKYGTFTGNKLSDYITSTKTDFQTARRIINRLDKAALIAGYAFKIAKCLS